MWLVKKLPLEEVKRSYFFGSVPFFFLAFDRLLDKATWAKLSTITTAHFDVSLVESKRWTWAMSFFSLKEADGVRVQTQLRSISPIILPFRMYQTPAWGTPDQLESISVFHHRSQPVKINFTYIHI